MVDSDITARLEKERFDRDPKLKEFVGITISALQDLEGNDSEFPRPGLNAIWRWSDAFPPGDPASTRLDLLCGRSLS